MLMYLAKEPVYTIMLVGRWSSDAFLAYIEKQIKEFTRGVSTRMLQHETFCNIPAFNSRAPSIQHHLVENQEVHSPKHHRRDIHKAVFGRQGPLRRAVQPRNHLPRTASVRFWAFGPLPPLANPNLAIHPN